MALDKDGNEIIEPVVPPVDPIVPPVVPPTTPVEVKWEDLTPAQQSYVDKQRTQASKTARENASKDPTLLATIKAQLEAEANLSVDDKLNLKMEELDVRTNRLDARDYLTKNLTIENEDLDNALEMLVSKDKVKTMERTKKYVTNITKLVTNATDAKVQALIKGTPKPNTPPTKVKTYTEMGYEERIAYKEKDPTGYKADVAKNHKGF